MEIKTNKILIRDPDTKKYEPFLAIQGESAYEIAKRYGYKGTEEEWNNALETERIAAITSIEEKGQQTRESIPEDYTALSEEVARLEEDKFDKANIAQELGNSEEKVLSQKVTTKEIFNIDKRLNLKADVEKTNLYEYGVNGYITPANTIALDNNNPNYYKTSKYYKVASGESVIISDNISFFRYVIVDGINGAVISYYEGNYTLSTNGRNYYKFTADTDCFIRFSSATKGKTMIEYSEADTPSEYSDTATLSNKIIVSKVETADYAKNAKSAETATFAKSAETATFAINAGTLSSVADYTVKEFKAFTATIDNVRYNTVTVTSNATYGAIGIKDTFDSTGRYLIIWTGDYILNSSAMRTTSGWKNGTNTVTTVIGGISYHWSVFQFDETVYTDVLYLQTINQTTVTITIKKLFLIDSDVEVTNEYIQSVIGESYNLVEELGKLNSIKHYSNTWKGKNVLFIGDSLTAAKKYQDTVADILGINIYNHCKGGMGIIQCVDGENGAGEYDNETAVEGTLYALKPDDVRDMDLIVFYAGYNNRGFLDGTVGDCYPSKKTIAGYMQYAINRIYEELAEANNLTCKILVVTVDCAGKYPYINADGYEEWHPGSGQTMETLANVQKAIAEYNSLACLDLWHTSGINRNTWNVFGAINNPINSNYTKYELDADGNQIGTKPMTYVKGNSYYQLRNGVATLEEYTGSSPYPYNNDQLHKSTEGYKRIGECIAGAIIKAYGD